MKTLKAMLLLAVVAIFVAACEKDKKSELPVIEDGSYVGKMTILDAGGNVYHEQENVTMKIKVKAGEVIDLDMVAVKFAPTMPMSLNVTVPGITTADISTGYSLSGDNITPIAMGGPYTNIEMNDLDGSVTLQNLTFSMVCEINIQPMISGSFPLSFSGTKVE